MIQRDANPRDFAGTYEMAVAMSRHTNDGELIVVGGSSEVDQHGLLRASDCPYFFFWMDRKGFIMHDDSQSMKRVRELNNRGARFFVAERAHLNQIPGFEAELRSQFTVLEEFDNTILIDLGPSDGTPSNASKASARLTSETDAVRSQSADT